MTTYDVTGVDDTGTVDVTASLLAFFDTVPDGSTILFGAAKQYRCDGILRLYGRNGLTIDANGSTILTDATGTRTRSHWVIEGCTDTRLTNGVIRGPNVNAGFGDAAYVAALEAQHAFEILSATNTTIDHWTVSNIYGDWIYAGVSATFGTGTVICDVLLIEHNAFINNGRQGIGLVGCRDVEIRYNTTTDCRRSLIDLEPNGADGVCDNIWIHHNTFGRQRLSFLASKGYPGPISNVTVEDNTVRSSMFSEINPPGLGLRTNWIIRRNVAQGEYGSPGGRCMSLYRIDGLTVTNNVQPLQVGRQMVLALLRDCTNFDVSNNTIVNGIGQYVEINTPDPGTDPTTPVGEYTTPEVVGSFSGVSLGSSVSATLPTIEVGDLLCAVVGHRGVDFADRVVGWTVLDSTLGGSDIAPQKVLVRTVTQADITAGTVSFTFYENDRSLLAGVVIRGAPSDIPDSVVSARLGDDVSEIPLTGATTQLPGSLVVFVGAAQGGNAIVGTADAEVDMHVVARNNSAFGFGFGIGSKPYIGVGKGRNRVFTTGIQSWTYGVTIAFSGYPPPPFDADRPRFNLTVTCSG